MRDPLLTFVAFLSLALAWACGSSPTSPTATPASPAATTRATFTLSGRTADALTDGPVAGITVSLEDDGVTATSDAGGGFEVTLPSPGLCSVTLSGAGFVRRETGIRVPRTGASLSLIPASFDLASFDQMCRNDGQLHRWTTAPSLVIIDAVLRFTSLEQASFTALPERLGEEEQAVMAADLRWGLPQVTGGTFDHFASVSVESPAPGASVSFFSAEGQIVVARFSGLAADSGYAGYGRWARRGDAVVAGSIMLDRATDASHSGFTRSLRVHELGHALGYGHVTRRASFMNADGMVEPNEFDREATRLAFERRPGSRSPDRDPSPLGTDTATTGASSRVAWGPLAR